MLLRSPLEDPPPVQPRREPPKAVPVKKPPPQLNFTLLATMIDSQRSLATIADASKSDIKGVGETLSLSPAGVTIVSIESGQVTLATTAKSQHWSLKEKRKGGAGRPKK